jgi:hypothetical protein
METRPRRQQTTEKIGTPLELGIGTVHIERRNGSPFLSARAFSGIYAINLRSGYQHAIIL